MILTLLIINNLSYSITLRVIKKSSSINVNALTNIGYGFLAICALLIIIYVIENKITGYKERKLLNEKDATN